ncbi:MAG: T9SS type A sorting domain-containing protein [Bacteroidia bacterium]|jgi:hypothetical protein
MAATFCCCHFFSYAQNRNSVWCFGDSAGIDFGSGLPVTFQSGMDSRGSCVSISDNNGNLLFYAATMYKYAISIDNSTFVFNSTGSVMQDGDSIVGEGWYQELVIVPNPANDSVYYLFSINVTGNNGLVYSIIDMKQNGGLGAVTAKNIQLQSFEQVDCLNAVKHGNGRDWWLIFRKSDALTFSSNNDWYSYLITPNGIQNLSVQSVGSQNRTGGAHTNFSPDGEKLVFTNWLGLIEVYDFDRCTGLLNNPVTIEPDLGNPPYPFIWSCEFSPDESKLYVTTNQTTSYLFQYDLNAPNIPGSKDTLWSFNLFPYAIGGLKLAPDNKIYLSNVYYNASNYYPYRDSVYNMYNMNLSVINQPDSLGAACDFQPYSFYLGGKRTYLGLPNNPDYELEAVAGSVCDTLTGIAPSPLERGGVRIFPNPANSTLYVSGMPEGKNEIEVYDIYGRLLLKKNASAAGSIDVSSLSDGVYNLRIKNEAGEYFKKRFVVIK